MTGACSSVVAADVAVLLVEDDIALARSLCLALDDAGIAVRVAGSAASAMEAIAQHPWDAVLLDLGLPDEDGVVVCARIRESSDVPIVMVTARTDSRDVVGGLEAGADDYVTKPVVGVELAARVRALVRRSASGSTARWVECGPLRIDTEHGSVRLEGRELAVTRTERGLLRELALQCGQSVSREHLLQQVWGYDYFGDTRLLDVHFRRLRLKLESDPSQPCHLLTVRGLGYRLQP